MKTFGISNMAFHLPAPSLELDDLIRRRGAANGSTEKLERALAFTGQQRMRIPDWYEDTVTMVAESTCRLLDSLSAADRATIRHFYCGTETAQDAAKPVAAYVQGLLDRHGLPLGPNVATLETKHACASGTYALLGALNALAAESQWGLPGRAIAAMGDIASYPAGSTAELTQGAGAVSLLLEEDPQLLAVDLGLTGFYGEDVDDFFRAMPNRHASVRGRYSVDCYIRALAGAYEDYKQQALATGWLQRPPGGHFLDTFDYAVLHAPFHSMPTQAMQELIVKARGCGADEAAQELDRLRVTAGLELVRDTGNLYTGSLYLCLADLLAQEHRRLGVKLIGKRVLLASYGSGNTMVVFGATVMPGAPAVLESLALPDGLLANRRDVPHDEYETLATLDKFDARRYAALFQERGQRIPAGAYYLAAIRGDGYRVYERGGMRPER